jgi:hypothetical protein
MDAEGARELTRRIGSNAGVAIRPVPANVSEGAQPLFRWFDVAAAAGASDPTPPARSPSVRRARTA